MTLPVASQRSLQVKSLGYRLWHGYASDTSKRGSFILGLLAFILAGVLYQLGLSILRWSMPFKAGGVICLLLFGACVYLGMRWMTRALLRWGLKRVLFLLVIIYFLAVVLAGLFFSTLEQGIDHWQASVRIVNLSIVRRISDLGRAIIESPDAIKFAITGHRIPLVISGAQSTVTSEPTPIVVQLVPAGEVEADLRSSDDTTQPDNDGDSPSISLQVGAKVQVVGTDGAALRARTDPATDAPIVTRFPFGSTLRITDGPQVVDGNTWWKVQGEQGVGWCRGDFLQLKP